MLWNTIRTPFLGHFAYVTTPLLRPFCLAGQNRHINSYRETINEGLGGRKLGIFTIAAPTHEPR